MTHFLLALTQNNLTLNFSKPLKSLTDFFSYFRAFNICGLDNVCCRVPKTTKRPQTTTTSIRSTSTTQKGFFNFNPNFNLNNITNLLSTILKPVPTASFDAKPAAQACQSRTGKKIEKRILLDEDYDDENSLVGETVFAEYPWMLEILKKDRKTGKFEYKCGGVLSKFINTQQAVEAKLTVFHSTVSPTKALTANHCLKGSNIKASNFIIRAGEWDRSSELEFAPHHDRPVTQIIAHPQYYSGGLFNDIAILKWQKPLEPEVNVAPICLPDETETFAAGEYCTVTGWGKSSDDAPTTDKLKFAKVPIVPRSLCERQFQANRLGNRFKLHESFICAGGEVGIDSCKNDGGSPLTCPRKDGSVVLVGLVSWGLDCGLKDVPGAYTNIQNLLKWIQSQ